LADYAIPFHIELRVSLGMLAVVFASFGLMLAAGWMHEIIGPSWASVVSAVMAIILAADSCFSHAGRHQNIISALVFGPIN
jgi:small neutral amino acid transporter SnatA (MarC family)